MIPGYREVILGTPHPLLAYWRLGDAGTVVADTGPSARPLTLAGGVQIGVAGALDGDPDTAIHFDGVNGTAGRAFTAGLSDVTTVGISMWVKPDGVSVTTQMLDSLQAGVFRGYRINQVNLQRLQFLTGNGTLNATITQPSPGLPAGAWAHIGAIADGALSSLYVNGALIGSIATGMVGNTAARFALGSASAQTSGFWPGAQDEVAVFSILTAADILNHYNAGRVALLNAVEVLARVMDRKVVARVMDRKVLVRVP